MCEEEYNMYSNVLLISNTESGMLGFTQDSEVLIKKKLLFMKAYSYFLC